MPTLKCGLKNDRFTVSDTNIGNGALTYPVGLITADEAAMGGLLEQVENYTNYLFTDTLLDFYSVCSSSLALMFTINPHITAYDASLPYFGLRPVISISPKTKVTGAGTATNPFKVL